MVLLISNNYKKTNLIINIKIEIQKRFYPRNSLTGTLSLRNNTFFNNVNTLIPKPCYNMASFTPRSTTKIFPKIQNNIFILKTSSYHPINRDHFIQNEILDDKLTKLKAAIKEKNTQKPFSDKSITLKTINNKEYETNITINTKINDISNEQLILELKKRELVKDDPGNTAVSIKLEDNSNYLLGSSKNKIKLSSLGQAYKESMSSNNKIINTNNFANLSEIKVENFIIVIPPQNDDDLFIESGKQKHMLIVADGKGAFYCIGYLTSKNTGDEISNQQFKIFQNNKEEIFEQTPLLTKKQFFVKFDNLYKITEENIKPVKWHTQYLEQLSEDIKKYLVDKCEELDKKPYDNFDNKGITKQDCLNMCIKHDNIAQQKDGKHPLTKDQIKQNENNKKKQLEDNKVKLQTKKIYYVKSD